MSMLTLIDPIPDYPTDAEGTRIRLGDKVYLPAGWTGTKPNPWTVAYVAGVVYSHLPASGSHRWWLHIEGQDTRSVPAHIVCKRQVVEP